VVLEVKRRALIVQFDVSRLILIWDIETYWQLHCVAPFHEQYKYEYIARGTLQAKAWSDSDSEPKTCLS
jgi:YD repeat-containing protein